MNSDNYRLKSIWDHITNPYSFRFDIPNSELNNID
jgi:hypothetical protein